MGAQAALDKLTLAWWRWNHLGEGKERNEAATELHVAHLEADRYVPKHVKDAATTVEAWEALIEKAELDVVADAAKKGASHITDDTEQGRLATF